MYGIKDVGVDTVACTPGVLVVVPGPAYLAALLEDDEFATGRPTEEVNRHAQTYSR